MSKLVLLEKHPTEDLINVTAYGAWITPPEAMILAAKLLALVGHEFVIVEKEIQNTTYVIEPDTQAALDCLDRKNK